MNERLGKFVSGYGNEEEKLVMTGVETMAAKAFGYDIRTTHRGNDNIPIFHGKNMFSTQYGSL